MFEADTARGVDKAAAAVSAAEPFSIVAQPKQASVGDMAVANGGAWPLAMRAEFCPAATGQLGGPENAIGVPAGVGSEANSTGSTAPEKVLYFAILTPMMGSGKLEALPPSKTDPPSKAAPGLASAASLPSHVSSKMVCRSADTPSPLSPLGTFKRPAPTIFTDVRLGPMVGRGAYGRVYRGTWNGNTVAVKVIETEDTVGPDEAIEVVLEKRGFFEAVLASNISHPNIVSTYHYATRPVAANQWENDPSRNPEKDLKDERKAPKSAPAGTCVAPARSARRGSTEIWLISEFCNRGPLLTAIERGVFITQPAVRYGQPDLVAVLQTLQEMAAAMHYLHSHGVVHGDLTGGNVLLTASDKDARGFTAKIVDFGLSRVCPVGLETKTMGCAEYM
jgi:hypothetical protein